MCPMMQKREEKCRSKKFFYLNPSLCVYSKLREGSWQGGKEELWIEVRLLIRSEDILRPRELSLIDYFHSRLGSPRADGA